MAVAGRAGGIFCFLIFFRQKITYKPLYDLFQVLDPLRRYSLWYQGVTWQIKRGCRHITFYCFFLFLINYN